MGNQCRSCLLTDSPPDMSRCMLVNLVDREITVHRAEYCAADDIQMIVADVYLLCCINYVLASKQFKIKIRKIHSLKKSKIDL